MSVVLNPGCTLGPSEEFLKEDDGAYLGWAPASDFALSAVMPVFSQG